MAEAASAGNVPAAMPAPIIEPPVPPGLLPAAHVPAPLPAGANAEGGREMSVRVQEVVCAGAGQEPEALEPLPSVPEDMSIDRGAPRDVLQDRPGPQLERESKMPRRKLRADPVSERADDGDPSGTAASSSGTNPFQGTAPSSARPATH